MPKETKEIKNNRATKKSKDISSIETTSIVVSKKKKSVSKSNNLKRTNSSKNTVNTKKVASKINTVKKTFNNLTSSIEYYDLPYRYNETIIRILFQTPKKLFVYWDISDTDRKSFISKFGEDFFNDTIPFLLVHNVSKNYSFEVEISDFANSWYFNVNDEKCEYTVELYRRSKVNNNTNISDNSLFITSSNQITTPNNHILFEPINKTVYFRNVKNNSVLEKNIANLQYVEYIGKIYNIYDLYKKIYKNEEVLNLESLASTNPTSTFN